jgi:hypothetical protein
MTVAYRAPVVTPDGADVAVDFRLKAVLERSELAATAAEGGGTLSIHLERRGGPVTATRASTMSLVRPGARDQIIGGHMELARGR